MITKPKKLNIRIAEDLLNRLNAESIKRNETASDIVREALKKELAK